MPIISDSNIGSNVYVTILPNMVSKALYHMGDEEGLVPIRLIQKGRRGETGAIILSQTIIPFASLAPYIIQMGFKLTITKIETEGEAYNREIEEFENTFGDLVDSEMALKDRAENPSYKETWGDTSISKQRRADIEEMKEFNQDYGKPKPDNLEK